jgi:hypothetical protein
MQLISGGVDVQMAGRDMVVLPVFQPKSPGDLTILALSFRRTRKFPNEELANESRSTHIAVAADMVFSLSHYLSGVCCMSVVALSGDGHRRLSDVPWEEIQSSRSRVFLNIPGCYPPSPTCGLLNPRDGQAGVN